MGIMHADINSILDAIKREIVKVIGNCKSWSPPPLTTAGIALLASFLVFILFSWQFPMCLHETRSPRCDTFFCCCPQLEPVLGAGCLLLLTNLLLQLPPNCCLKSSPDTFLPPSTVCYTLLHPTQLRPKSQNATKLDTLHARTFGKT